MSKIMLFDMDNSIVDHNGKLTKDLYELKSPYEPDYPVYNDLPKYVKNRVSLIRSKSEWWSNLPPLYDGIFMMDVASDIGYKCYIISKGPENKPEVWDQKLLWCQKNAPDVDVIITTDKSVIRGDILYDDWPEHMDAWLANNPDGLGIMPAQPYNIGYLHKNYVQNLDLTHMKG